MRDSYRVVGQSIAPSLEPEALFGGVLWQVGEIRCQDFVRTKLVIGSMMVSSALVRCETSIPMVGTRKT